MKYIKLFEEKTSYPKSSRDRTDDAKYNFKIYLDDGEKHHTDYYTHEDALKMQSILKSKGETFEVIEWDNEGYGEEVYL